MNRPSWMMVMLRLHQAILAVFFLSAWTLPASFAVPAPAHRPFKVVLDPGHGGSDRGTVYESGPFKIAEKDITLLLAHETAEKLRARGISVILTRSLDRDMSLQARTALANKVRADAFISIHMNSTAGASPTKTQGIETYILNNATDASSKRLAHFENKVLTPVEDREKGVSDTEPENLDVALILKDLRLDANLSESKRLACAIQTNLVGSTGKLRLPGVPAVKGSDRGVKQALFYVLLGADMPSALVEAGFLNSARDRAVVLSPRGRKSIADAIARSIDQFRVAGRSPAVRSVLNKCKVN